MAVALWFLVLAGNDAQANSGLAGYEQPWELCGLCHSLDGNSRMVRFPRLAGQPAAYIEKQVHDFLAGRRTNDGGQMSAIVTEIDVADIERIAQWFASQEPPPPVGDVSLTQAGQQLYVTKGCSDCHAAGGSARDTLPIPYLTAQHAQYLVKQLRDFQSGNRVHVSAELASDPVAQLTSSEIDSLATYLAASARE